jgi:2-phospho-L-lactate guanylyltransferase
MSTAAASTRGEFAHGAVVVPIRSFARAKERLAARLDVRDRHTLVLELAERVLSAASGRAIAVVSDDLEVRRVADAHGASVLADPGTLDGAAAAGCGWAASLGARRVAIVHADLPFVEHLDRLFDPGAAPVAVLVPDQRGDGTPALSIPTGAPFRFAYGPGSFARHVEAAVAAGLQVRIARDPHLGFDLDLPEDLDALARRAPRVC